MSSVPGLGTSPGEENGNLLQDSCLEKSTHREAWQARVHGVTKSQTTLSVHMAIFINKVLVDTFTFISVLFNARFYIIAELNL